MKVSILDCTLRDGGYINNFHFGSNRKQTVKEKLCTANIEIIECGFLQSGKNDPEYSLYGAIDQILLPRDRKDCMFVAMIAFGEMSIDEIAPRQPGYIDAIRLTFHDDEWEPTKTFAIQLMEKGYQVFIQPVGCLYYTDEHLLNLIKDVNEINPFAFYIVDTLGSMYKKDLLRLFHLIEHNLAPYIRLGFHSHNNMQLSFSNCIELLEQHTQRHIILDASVYGMGRGAGNLNTELITHYINQNIENRYNTILLLELIDDIILPIYKHSVWGFSEPYYLSAIMDLHPNYASFLIDKQAVGMTRIAGMLNKLPRENRHLYRKSDIETLYHAEMSNNVEDNEAIKKLADEINDQPVLVIAPGTSIRNNKKDINKYIHENNPYIISLNFMPDEIESNLIFISNRKRFEQFQNGSLSYPTTTSLAVTSNISANGAYVIDYDSLLTGYSDFSGAMVLKFLIRLGLANVALAGYDGFAAGENHFYESFDRYRSQETTNTLNKSINEQLVDINKMLKLTFITPTIYEVQQ